MPPKLKKLKSRLTFSVLITTLLAFTLTQGGCMTQKKQDPYDEGDIVTWKLWGEMIIKAEVGERREHFVAMTERGEREFYRPEAEHYLGQFPIDYQPKQFATLTKEEALALPMTPIMPGQALEFYLMLNGSWVQATDNSINASDGLDHPDQVKVIVNPDARQNNTMSLWEAYQNNPPKNPTDKYQQYGLYCHVFEKTGSLRCFGRSNNPNVSAVRLKFFGDQWIFGESWGEGIYGGVKIRWRFDSKNIDQWQEIDANIWRLIDAWNIAPIEQSPLSPPA